MFKFVETPDVLVRNVGESKVRLIIPPVESPGGIGREFKMIIF